MPRSADPRKGCSGFRAWPAGKAEVLSVSQVAPDGKATVGYHNPRPIRVSRAEARRERDLVGLFVELNDVNYPGSTYTLGYDSASGELKGVYFQAVERVQYEVVFVRRR